VLRCELKLRYGRVDAELLVEMGREERGVRLGRDLLAGRFLVDPERDEPFQPEPAPPAEPELESGDSGDDAPLERSH
jgi:hypothetical protein